MTAFPRNIARHGIGRVCFSKCLSLVPFRLQIDQMGKALLCVIFLHKKNSAFASLSEMVTRCYSFANVLPQ